MGAQLQRFAIAGRHGLFQLFEALPSSAGNPHEFQSVFGGDSLHRRNAVGILRGNAETVAIPFAGAAVDVDTPEDVQRLLASSPNAIRR